MLPESSDYKKFIRPQNPTIIDLGTQNGWNQEKNQLYKFLVKNRTSPTKTKNLNRNGTYREFTFDVKLDGQTYTVRSEVDSSD